jgi:hypothetical protein
VTDASERRAHGAQPASDDSGDQRTTAVDKGYRRSADLDDERTDQRTHDDPHADERDVGDVGRPVGNAEQLGYGAGVLRAADDRDEVAALQRGVRQDRDVRGRSRRA